MLLTLQDDRVLCVYASIADAVHDVEALDAPEVFRAVFDEDCRWYRIEWIEPNRSGSLLDFRMVANGRYTLVFDGSRDPQRALSAIREAVAVEPPSSERFVRELEARIAEAIDRPTR